MKTPPLRNRNNTLMRCLFGLAILVLFIPQLSYKFYLCANNPAWAYKCLSAPHIRRALAGAGTVSLTYQHCRPLSVDKRYDLKHLFAFIPARIGTVNGRPCSWSPVGYCTPDIITGWLPALPLRGPPPAVPSLSWFI